MTDTHASMYKQGMQYTHYMFAQLQWFIQTNTAKKNSAHVAAWPACMWQRCNCLVENSLLWVVWSPFDFGMLAMSTHTHKHITHTHTHAHTTIHTE